MPPSSWTGPRSLGTTSCARIICVLLLLLLSSLDAARAAHNVTVDDIDTTLIDYEPPTSWEESPPDPLDANGSHMVTDDPSATATFTFTGVAIYFYAPLFPSAVSTAVSLDGEEPITIDLQDPNAVTVDGGRETTLSSVVWSAIGLANVPHTLVVSVVQGESSAIVDSLVYTVLDPGDPGSSTTSLSSTTALSTSPAATSDTTTPSSTSTPTSTSTSFLLPSSSSTSNNLSTNSQSPAAKRGLSIALGLVCTIFGLLVLAAIYWYWRRRQRQKREEEYMRQYYSSSSGGGGSTGGGGGPGGGPLSPGSSGVFSASEMAETGASTSTFSTMTNLGAYNSPSRFQNPSSTPKRPFRSSPGSSRRVAPPVPVPAVVGVVGNGRARTASRRLGSSPLAMHQPLTPTGDGASPLSTIPEMRMREREERESATGTGTTSSFGGGTGGEYKIGVVSPSTVQDPNGSMNGNGQMPTPITMPVPHPAEPPWSELGERSGSGGKENEVGAEQNSGRKKRWNRTFDDRMVKFS